MKNSITLERRAFIQKSTLGIFALLGTAAVGVSPFLNAKELRLRPPGAVKENEFLSLCIKCGQCAQVCPYHSIELADIFKGHGVGTPYIDALDRACYLCTALPCVLACPTHALNHETEKPQDVQMGIAVFKYSNRCIGISKEEVTAKDIARITSGIFTSTQEKEVLEKIHEFEDEQCTICADMCPYPNALDAIEMVYHQPTKGQKPKIKSSCVGCGVCAELCPTDAIVIEPRLNYDEYYVQKKRY